MNKAKAAPRNVDEYIAGFSPEVQKQLQRMRRAIRKAVPGALEAIKYAIPTYVLNGNLVSFSGNKTHIGLYPVPVGDPAFAKDLKPYASGKATGKFSLEAPLPVVLIGRIVKYRALKMAAKTPAAKRRPRRTVP
jgi:uncharacterized protein YdhG (YjbR/CyaY superfamily)